MGGRAASRATVRCRMHLCVLGLSSRSNGELTMALDVAARLRPEQLTAVVGTPSVRVALAYGAQVRTFPLVGATLAYQRIVEHLTALKPDVILLADLALLHLSTELGPGLLPLAWFLPSLAPTVALDLYDWDHNAATMDTFGRALHTAFPPVPPSLGRLAPCPLNTPRTNAAGRGHYRVMEDVGPLSNSARQTTRDALGLTGPVVLWTTSAWQHPVAGRMHMAPHQTVLKEAAQGERTMLSFPAYALRLLERVAQRMDGATLLHVGPQPFAVPDGLTSLRYQHHASLPPERFVDLLGCVDLLFNPNTPSSTAWRATTRRVPVLSVHQTVEGSVSDADAKAYLDALGPTFSWSVWPVGLHVTVHNLLQANPVAAAAHRHVNVLQADAVVDAAVSLLKAPDGLRHAQDALWRSLEPLETAQAFTAAARMPHTPRS